MVKKRVQAILQKLQACYTCGLQPYPRIDNDFILTTKLQFFPHPSFNRSGINNGSLNVGAPLKETKFFIDKRSAFLFLSLARLMSPADIISVAEMLDRFFNDDLSFQNNGAEYIVDEIIQIYDKVREEDDVKEKTIKANYLNFCETVSSLESNSHLLCFIPNLFFGKQHKGLSDKPSLIESAFAVMKDKNDDNNLPLYYETSSIFDAIDFFKQKQEIMKQTQAIIKTDIDQANKISAEMLLAIQEISSIEIQIAQ